jgi:hypothetical protein
VGFGPLASPSIAAVQRIDRVDLELLIQIAVIWVWVFGLLTVILSFTPSTDALPIEGDAARAATLVDAVMRVLLTLFPPKMILSPLHCISVTTGS